ncbi:hypothetical protein GM415_00860 [Pseudodesulfovibrio cashew]|uniref:Uncharacterized protein n=1 Tax=Pseudodesulfovibrio cashew TaxID=2678688 RepID=A0A6I6JCD2_9BACT|nr:hypothetical protein [Pseudodesulfovibrio cashew]QGY38748.1 hypothetical protein GM415_00860 [Pseudodesulfovibrio cashew]
MEQSNAIYELEKSILRMTAMVRQGQADEVARSFGENPDAEKRPLGWWVLACGEKYDEEDERQRDAARDTLLREVRLAGLVLSENIWVWDEEGIAQLVISTLPTLGRAERLAGHLRRKGLIVRVRREMI